MTALPVMIEEKKTVRTQWAVLKPVAPADELVEAWLAYQEVKSKLLVEGDYLDIRGKRLIRKSGWRKIQTAFGISDDIVQEERKEHRGYFVYEITVRVSVANGRTAMGVGSCASNERQFAHAEHDVRSIAHTRAKNRAISDLVGGGEVSAEEMETQTAYRQADVVAYPEREEGGQPPFEAPITVKQQGLLLTLIEHRVADYEEREQLYGQMGSLTKETASELISDLMNRQI